MTLLLAEVNFEILLRNELIKAIFFFLIWALVSPIIFWLKNKLSKVKLYSLFLLSLHSKKIVDSIRFNSIQFDSVNINNTGKADLVNCLISTELETINSAFYSFFCYHLRVEPKNLFHRIKLLSLIDQLELIRNLATEYESSLYLVRLAQARILTSKIEISHNKEIPYLKRYKETLTTDTDIKGVIRNKEIERILSKYDKILNPCRTIITKQIISNLSNRSNLESIITDIISDVDIIYTSTLITMHHQVNDWNGEFKGIAFNGYDL